VEADWEACRENRSAVEEYMGTALNTAALDAEDSHIEAIAAANTNGKTDKRILHNRISSRSVVQGGMVMPMVSYRADDGRIHVRSHHA
jgi:hypothetical protein